jgi:hypothetical protein
MEGGGRRVEGRGQRVESREGKGQEHSLSFDLVHDFSSKLEMSFKHFTQS